jgi:hypothetical protein
MKIVIVPFASIKTLPDIDRRTIRLFVRGGNREEIRYSDSETVYEIITRNKLPHRIEERP